MDNADREWSGRIAIRVGALLRARRLVQGVKGSPSSAFFCRTFCNGAQRLPLPVLQGAAPRSPGACRLVRARRHAGVALGIVAVVLLRCFTYRWDADSSFTYRWDADSSFPFRRVSKGRHLILNMHYMHVVMSCSIRHSVNSGREETRRATRTKARQK
jgi:hypothetical protein